MRHLAITACIYSDLVAVPGQRCPLEIGELLAHALAMANSHFHGRLWQPLVLTRGTEWLAVADSTVTAFEIDLFLRQRLFPRQIATGIGVSESQQIFADNNPDSCRGRARLALEKARQQRGGTILSSGIETLDIGANAISLLLHTLFAGWTEKQLEAYLAYREHNTEAAAAAAVGITQSALHQRLSSANAKIYESASANLLWFVGKFYPPSTAARPAEFPAYAID